VHGTIPPLAVTVAKTNDANGDGTFTDDETGATGDDVNFRAVITNNSAVAVVINSISDVWPGASAITPDCAAQVVGITLAANGGSVTCDFTVTDYVPSSGDGAKVNTVTVEVCEDGHADNCDTPHDTTTVRGGNVLAVTVEKTNDANGDNNFTDDETGTAGDDVVFRVTISNDSAVDVVITSLTDVWPNAAEIAPCADLIGTTIAAGASVSCDFTVTDYVPSSGDGAKINTVTVETCEDGDASNCTTPHDTTTVRGVDVLGEVITQTPQAPTLPRTGAANTMSLLTAGLGLLLLGLGLVLAGSQLAGSSLLLRLPSSAGMVRYPSPPVIDRNLSRQGAGGRRAPGVWSSMTARQRGKFKGR